MKKLLICLLLASGCKKIEVEVNAGTHYENTRYVECGKYAPMKYDHYGDETSFKTPYGSDAPLTCKDGTWKPVLTGPWYLCDCGGK